MVRTTTIKLDGVEYAVPALNIGQLERLSDAFELPAGRIAYAVLRVALERAEPKVDMEQVAPSVDEIREAFQAVAELSGFAMKKTNGSAENPTQPGAVIN